MRQLKLIELINDSIGIKGSIYIIMAVLLVIIKLCTDLSNEQDCSVVIYEC